MLSVCCCLCCIIYTRSHCADPEYDSVTSFWAHYSNPKRARVYAAVWKDMAVAVHMIKPVRLVIARVQNAGECRMRCRRSVLGLRLHGSRARQTFR